MAIGFINIMCTIGEWHCILYGASALNVEVNKIIVFMCHLSQDLKNFWIYIVV